MGKFIHIAIIIILGFILYANSLSGKFVWDDEFLARDNVYIKNPAQMGHFFTQSIGAGADRQGPCYRPLQMLTFALDYFLTGTDVRGYHLTNIFLHILVSLAIYWLVGRLFLNPQLAFLTALLFIAHPVHSEAIAYISGRADPLAALFMLLALIFYIGRTRISLVLFFYILALLSKEYSLILPLLLLTVDYAAGRKPRLKNILPILSVTILFIVLRATILKFTPESLSSTSTFWQRIPGFFAAIAEYLRLLILPYNLHMEYGNRLFNLFSPYVILGIMILCFAMVYMFVKWITARLTVFSLLWFFAGLIPVSNLYPLNAYMAEHWLYVPSMGFFLILASLLNDWKRARIFGFSLIISILCFWSYSTIKQNNYWLEPINFYKRTLEFSPRSFRLYHNLANAYSSSGKKQEALEAFKAALRINPNSAQTYNSLGCVYSSLGAQGEAISNYEKALKLNPRYADAYYNLGNAYALSAKRSEAEICFRKAIAINPLGSHAVGYYANLAAMAAARGDIKEAKILYSQALKIDPRNAMVNKNLRSLSLIKQ